MNLSSIRTICNDVGIERFNSLLLPKDTKPKSDPNDKPIADKTIKLITDLVKRYKNPSRELIVDKSNLSKSTVTTAIRILFKRGVITKKTINAGSYRTVNYSLSK